MTNIDGVLFIDANQYLDLYRRMTNVKGLLGALKEQQDHIFVTAQVADEVHRRKVEVAAIFLTEELKKLESRNIAVPDHFLNTKDGRVGQIRGRLRDIEDKIKTEKEEFMKLVHYILDQISRSEDEVSKALAAIFARAVPHNDGELQRARARKERGSAPGKKTDPLGDQLIWEQILSRCQNKGSLWIITRDGDYAAKCGDKTFLNAALYQDLSKLRQPAPEVFCFNDILDGIKHFAETTHVKAEQLPTPEEAEQIKKEQESLPPLDWLFYNYNDATLVVLQNAYMRQKASAALLAALSNTTAAAGVLPPPETGGGEDHRA
jgi:hypothetical protein